MCRPDHFRIVYKINAWMHLATQPNAEILHREYEAIVAAHQAAGRAIKFIEPNLDFPDMTFTANHASIRGKKAILATLPPERQGEVDTTHRWLEAQGYEVIPSPYLFSGQGDALPTDTGAVIKGRKWRSDPRTDDLVRDYLGYEIIPVQTISQRWYDIDLVIAVLRPGLIAVCLDAFDQPSQKLLQSRPDLEIIPVSLEATEHFALNLISDGTTVTMPAGAPELEHTLQKRGFTVVPLPITQLMLSGGGVRCTALALDPA